MVDLVADPRFAALPRSFFARPTVIVARELLGRYLVLEVRAPLSTQGSGLSTPATLLSTQDSALSPHRRVARIVETEAYLGEEDRACHAFHGQTKRTTPMYEAPGHAYVYFVYGMHWCLNVVTEAVGRPYAVLLRAAEPVEGVAGGLDGPAKLCRGLGLDARWNRADLTAGDLRITVGQPVPASDVEASPRIGVKYAGEWADRPLRFFVGSSPHVSGARSRTRRPAPSG